MREREVEKYLVGRLETSGIGVMKCVPDQRPGMPDRIVLLPNGRVIWVELKTVGGRVSKLQKYRHAELKRLGHEVEVVWTKDQADAFVQRVKEKLERQELQLKIEPPKKETAE